MLTAELAAKCTTDSTGDLKILTDLATAQLVAHPAGCVS